MLVRNKDEVVTKTTEGLVSHALLQEGDVPSDELVVTWVEVDPGARQMRHHHDPEQVYVIVQGAGMMHVSDEVESVARGDLIHIPSNEEHYVENTGDEP